MRVRGKSESRLEKRFGVGFSRQILVHFQDLPEPVCKTKQPRKRLSCFYGIQEITSSFTSNGRPFALVVSQMITVSFSPHTTEM